jgi:proteasome lid subunit RPN8/RPN11
MEFLEPKLNRSGVLRFTAYAFAKIKYMRDKGSTEIGGYGICETDDPLLINDFKLVKQQCTGATVELDTEDSMKFVEDMVDKGFSPWAFQNVWIHTHPSNCPKPSLVDEANFDKNFSHPACAIFYILARGGDSYTRMRFNTPPGIDVEIQSETDYSVPFPASDHESWKKEYEEKVSEVKYPIVMIGDGDSSLNWINKLRETYDHVYPNGTTAQTMQELCDEKDEMDENLEMFWCPKENVCWFWNEEEDDYWKYDPDSKRFYDENDNQVTFKNIPKECELSEIIRFAQENFNATSSFLNETQDIEYCMAEE